jgi:hypothetical protein
MVMARYLRHPQVNLRGVMQHFKSQQCRHRGVFDDDRYDSDVNAGDGCRFFSAASGSLALDDWQPPRHLLVNR